MLHWRRINFFSLQLYGNFQLLDDNLRRLEINPLIDRRHDTVFEQFTDKLRYWQVQSLGQFSNGNRISNHQNFLWLAHVFSFLPAAYRDNYPLDARAVTWFSFSCRPNSS